ncbi:MAG TPA: N-acetyltransferase [Gemmatimonadales bacterium]|nr:N-acetyltransferase [Gemmatimonadales bacterium]
MDVSFRTAISSDIPALREVFGSEPSEEQLGASGGDRGRARRFRELIAGSLFGPSELQRTIVAVAGDKVVGFCQSGAEGGGGVSLRVVWGVVRIFGLRGALGFLRRDRLRARVQMPAPADAFHIAELHVLSSARNLGIGAKLLEQAERTARAEGASQMSLTTATNNPAIRLYERAGFEVVETKVDADYRASTGVDGRVMMAKSLV